MSNPAPGFAKHPNYRVVATQTPQRARVLVGDTVIADSRAAFEVAETNHPPVWYFPPKDVDEERLEPSETTSYCPFKGRASYWNVTAEDRTVADAAWAYLEPYDECRALTGYYAFYPDRVRVEVGGTEQRPTR
jgi:uncharacterized protein (DUF427 family)